MRGLLLVAGVLATGRPAWAKYDPCGHISMLEAAGRAPRNAKIWMWRGGDERLRIRGPGLDRAIAPPVDGSRRGLTVLDPGVLGRGETYRIQIVGDGYAWTLGELETESELDLVPPRAPGFHALAITQLLDPRAPDGAEGGGGGDVIDDIGGFGEPASDIATALELSADTVALDIVFDDSAEHFIMPADDPGMLGRNRCGPGRRFLVGAYICMSIRAIDLAGNRSEAATRCTTVGGRLGDTRRAAYAPEWRARRRHPPARPGGGLALAALALLAGFAGWRLASRQRAPADLVT
jgi:hypothetical protein